MAALCSSLSGSLSLRSSRISSTNGRSNCCELGTLRSVNVSDSACFTGRVSFECSRDTSMLRLRVERLSWPCEARRKSTSTMETDPDVLDDEDLRAGLNETVTEALKVMLAEDDRMLENFKDKVDHVGEFLVQNDQVEAARFLLILRGMLDHEIYPQCEELEGPYKKAFYSMWSVLEDSGWLLKQPGAEIPEVEDDSGEPELEIRFT